MMQKKAAGGENLAFAGSPPLTAFPFVLLRSSPKPDVQIPDGLAQGFQALLHANEQIGCHGHGKTALDGAIQKLLHGYSSFLYP